MSDPRRGKMSLPVIAGLVINAVVASLRLIDRSGHPGHYYQYRQSAEGFVYPTEAVCWWVGVIAVEMLVAAWLLRRATSVPKQALVLAVVFGAAFLAMLPFAMHAPPYFGGHAMALLFAACWLGLAAIVTGLIRARCRALGAARS